MKIRQVEVGMTYNIGNYESRRLAITMELTDADEPVILSEVMRGMQKMLDEQNANLERETRRRPANGR